MFTGLIQHVGRVAALDDVPFGRTLLVDPAGWPHRPSEGDSIAVNGCCLTVAEPPPAGGAGPWRFDVVRQTLDRTTLGTLAVGDRVNLEHSVTPQTLLGGHLVQGHVDATAEVVAVTDDPTQWRTRFRPPAATMDLIVDQGSITVDGVSLTVAATGPDWFEVALIPTTLEATTLADRRPGAVVNLETDVVARTVAHLLARAQGRAGD